MRGKKTRRRPDAEHRTAPVLQETGAASPTHRRRRKLWFRLGALVLVLLVVWGIPELVVRIAKPTLETYRAIRFGGDPNSLKLFMKDAQLHWKLRPSVETEFLQTTVRTDRYGFRGDVPVSGRRVVLCLGDSTVFGYRVEQADSFPARLQFRLNGRNPSGSGWNVVNAGVPGYSSFQVRLLAEKLVPRWKPDVIVVCVGNNEACPVARSDRQVAADRALTSRLVSLLSASRFLVWGAETVCPDQPQPFISPVLENAVARVSRDEFGENLRAIAQIARAANAKLILLSPPVNVYWKPMRTDQFAGWEKWEGICQSVRTAWNAGEREKAREIANTAVAKYPDSYVALWIQGIVVTDSGDVEGGRELLEQSIEHHPFPENCKRSYREVLAQVAREEKIPCLDANSLFRSHAEGPTPQSLYLDWCHPTPQGHGILASALFEAMRSEKD